MSLKKYVMTSLADKIENPKEEVKETEESVEIKKGRKLNK